MKLKGVEHMQLKDKKDLMYLGLTENQAAVFLTLLETGPLSIAQLARLSGLSRQGAYNIIEQLEHKNLVRDILGSQTKYEARSPNQLLRMIREKQAELENELKQFRDKQEYFENISSRLLHIRAPSSTRPNVALYEDGEGMLFIKKTIEHLANDSTLSLLCHSFTLASAREYCAELSTILAYAVERGIHVVPFCSDGPLPERFFPPAILSRVIRLPKETFSSACDILVTHKNVILVIHADQRFFISIEYPALAKTFLSIGTAMAAALQKTK